LLLSRALLVCYNESTYQNHPLSDYAVHVLMYIQVPLWHWCALAELRMYDIT